MPRAPPRPGGCERARRRHFWRARSASNLPFPFRIEHPRNFSCRRMLARPSFFSQAAPGYLRSLASFRSGSGAPQRARVGYFGPCALGQDFVCDAELGPALRAGLLELDVCFTRESAEVQVNPAGQLGVREGSARRISGVSMRAPRDRAQVMAAARGGQLQPAPPSTCVGGAGCSFGARWLEECLQRVRDWLGQRARRAGQRNSVPARRQQPPLSSKSIQTRSPPTTSLAGSTFRRSLSTMAMGRATG